MVAPWTDAQIGTERYPVWFIEEFRRSAEARRVDRDDDECWPWSETVAQSGIYGVFSRRRDGIIYSDRVHRLSVIAYKAGVPAGMHATHSCDWRPCYNPGHLDARTPEENTHDTFQRNVHIRQSMRESQLRRWREARA